MVVQGIIHTPYGGESTKEFRSSTERQRVKQFEFDWIDVATLQDVIAACQNGDSVFAGEIETLAYCERDSGGFGVTFDYEIYHSKHHCASLFIWFLPRIRNCRTW